MAIDTLHIEKKTQNQGASSAGKLTALEFNDMVGKINELVDAANKRVYITQDEYDRLVASDDVQDDVEYNIYDE